MGLLDLLCAASMPVLKILLITALGSFLALDGVDILGESGRKHLNAVVYFVFNPALVSTNLARTLTLESLCSLWYMPLNVLITFVIGSMLGWVLIKITKVAQHLKGLVLGSCAAGNLGNMPLIIIPAICREKASPFGATDICQAYGLAYASLSMAIGAVCLWSYVYNIVRLSSSNIRKEVCKNDSTDNTKSDSEISERLLGKCEETLLTSEGCSSEHNGCQFFLPKRISDGKWKVKFIDNIKQHLKIFQTRINLKALLTPSTTGAVSSWFSPPSRSCFFEVVKQAWFISLFSYYDWVSIYGLMRIAGFLIGVVPQLRNSMIGNAAPLRVIQDSATMLGHSAIPALTLILGGNLLKGLKGSGIPPSLIIGIIMIRYILLPLLGTIIVKGAIHFGLVHSDPLYQFVLLLQFALPPAMNIGTMTQMFGAGESECSVIFLWTYALSSVSLTLWSTFFMWLVA